MTGNHEQHVQATCNPKARNSRNQPHPVNQLPGGSMTAELLQTGATEFRTPLGAFRITGPHGPAPFTVLQHPVPDSHKGALKQY